MPVLSDDILKEICFKMLQHSAVPAIEILSISEKIFNMLHKDETVLFILSNEARLRPALPEYQHTFEERIRDIFEKRAQLFSLYTARMPSRPTDNFRITLDFLKINFPRLASELEMCRKLGYVSKNVVEKFARLASEEDMIKIFSGNANYVVPGFHRDPLARASMFKTLSDRELIESSFTPIEQREILSQKIVAQGGTIPLPLTCELTVSYYNRYLPNFDHNDLLVSSILFTDLRHLKQNSPVPQSSATPSTQ